MSILTSASPLSSDSMLKIEALIENYPNGGITNIQTFVNADFTDEEDTPTGLLVLHPVDAKVHVDSLPEHAFQYLAMCPILKLGDKTYTDADFPVETLDRVVHQYSANPPSLSLKSKSNKDLASWSPEIGLDGFAGIFKKIENNGRNVSYYIGVQAGAPVACREFKDYLLNKDLTFEQLVNDPKFSFVQHLARRNTQRLAYDIARAYKVPIRHSPDWSAKPANNYNAVPKRAEPIKSHMQAFSTVKVLPQGFRGESAVGVFHGVRPTKDVNSICFVTANPYDGIAVFNMGGKGLGHGLPASTGRAKTTNLRQLSAAEKQERMREFTWEGKTVNSEMLTDLHPEAFRQIDAQFLNSMKELGWRQEGLVDREYLVPVAVKLPNPDIKR